MVRWAQGSGRYTVVMAELRTINLETPDIFAVKQGHHSVVIECKISRSDFLADKKKPHRVLNDLGMGDERYFAVPSGLVEPKDLPEGWGLLSVEENFVRCLKESFTFTANKKAELSMVCSVMRRLEISSTVYVTSEQAEVSR
jgi:hypothetical protein